MAELRLDSDDEYIMFLQEEMFVALEIHKMKEGHDHIGRLIFGTPTRSLMKTKMSPEKIKQFVRALEDANLQYIIIAGVGLDGKRGYLVRPHQDLDVLCLKKDLHEIDKILMKLKYSGERHNDLYKVYDGDGGKADIGLVTIEGDDAVTYGSIAVTRFPKILFESPQKGQIDSVQLNIAPNELLRTWGVHSQKGDDSKYAASLPIDETIVSRITRVMRETSS